MAIQNDISNPDALPRKPAASGGDPKTNAAQLADARNRARRQAAISQSGNLALRPTQGQLGEGTDWQQRQLYGAMDAARQGQPVSSLEQKAIAGKLQADRIRATRARQIEAERKENRDLKQKTGESNPDYPHPIGFRIFLLFFFVALCQDLIPLIFDLVGIGWIIEYCLLPFTWAAYWLLIVRNAPRSLKRKFWQRTLLVTAAGWIPVVGQFLPEWIATALGAYIVISLYERKQVAKRIGQATNKARAGGAEGSSIAGKVAPAAAGASAGGAVAAVAGK